MRGRLLLAGLASLAAPAICRADPPGRPECSAIRPPVKLPGGRRALLSEDLVRLRDIGPTDPQDFTEPAFTLSPDGRQAAFQLRQADPQRNLYCLAMVILDLSGKTPPRLVDEGGEPLLMTIDLGGIAELPNGWMRTITPRWSADGRWIAFLKREKGITRVWRAYADGSGSAPVTRAGADVADFRIGADGASILYATLPGLERQRLENERESLDGWHYDDRFAPWFSKAPLPRAPLERRVEAIDGKTGAIRDASAAEAALFGAGDGSGTEGEIAEPDGRGLRIAERNIFGIAPAGGLRARLADGGHAACKRTACEGARNPWWAPDGKHVRFFRAEGWANASTAIYEWTVKTGEVRRLYITDDVLTGCSPDAARLFCLLYSSLQPVRLIRLDPVSGRRDVLFDPNPEFAHLALGKAERLHVLNASGIQSIADLVLPVGYRGGQKFPMVVVQYDTRGFLRGGTADEYPIQAFANRGYAVLSFSRPELVAQARGATTPDEVGRIDLAGFADRRSVYSSLENAVGIAIRRGVADPRQIGISGFSDGSSTVEWALVHSSLFSVAAVSSCCWDWAFEAHVGPAAARHFNAEGWPGVLGRADPFWRQVSLVEHARELTSPILVSTSDEELDGAILTYAGLREAHVPVDMYVYPGEYHARWQPAHRLAAYERVLDWFDYWLRGLRSSSPRGQADLKHWDRLREEARRFGRPPPAVPATPPSADPSSGRSTPRH